MYDPAQVSGSGRDGRITKEDAQQAVANAKATPAAPAAKPAETPEVTETPAAFSRNERVGKR
jgi:2-oxoglutarate dehydrogenase E2 component (dihydrolipoamide succinyltransferase)